MDQVLKLTLEVDPSEKYLPAQNIALYPRNSLSKVQRALKYLKGDPASVFVPQSPAKSKFPGNITLKSLFLHFLDLNGQIKKSVLKKTAACDVTLSQSQNFQNLIKNKNSLMEYNKMHKNIIDLLEDFKVKMNVEQFLTVCPSIKVSGLITRSQDTLQSPLS